MTQQLALFPRPGMARSDKERAALRRRRDRLTVMEHPMRQSTAVLRKLALGSRQTVIRIRPDFVYNSRPAAVGASGRNAPAREHRPPATRLISSRGAALRTILIALFEAQVRSRPGTYPDNSRPLFTRPEVIGWTDLVALDATASGSGPTYVSTRSKKGRQFCRTLDRLAAEQLVMLPVGKFGNIHEGFLLMHERGFHLADANDRWSYRYGSRNNDRYRTPRRGDTTFSIPTELFTNGWIHILEDSEIALLLILAYLQAKAPGSEFTINSEERVLNFGLGRDSYQTHTMLQRLGLATVTNHDREAHAEGFDHRKFAAPLAFRYHADGLRRSGPETLIRSIDSILEPS
jgi:hypothetical protein